MLYSLVLSGTKDTLKILSFQSFHKCIDYLIYTFESDQGCVIHFITIKDYLVSGSCSLGVGLKKCTEKQKYQNYFCIYALGVQKKCFFLSHLPL